MYTPILVQVNQIYNFRSDFLCSWCPDFTYILLHIFQEGYDCNLQTNILFADYMEAFHKVTEISYEMK
jgi:hypothetical protein